MRKNTKMEKLSPKQKAKIDWPLELWRQLKAEEIDENFLVENYALTKDELKVIVENFRYTVDQKEDPLEKLKRLLNSNVEWPLMMYHLESEAISEEMIQQDYGINWDELEWLAENYEYPPIKN